jgi:carboxymethylenebutenolidase
MKTTTVLSVLCGQACGILFTCLLMWNLSSQALASAEFKKVYYYSGNLRIAAYLYAPEGEGRFPAVIYNHGSRENPRRPAPFRYIGDMLSRNGYVTLIPERRGYGDSDGKTFDEEVGSDIGEKFVKRFKAEAADVLEGIPYLEALPNVDKDRINIMGWSFGGIVTLFAASETAFHAAIAQAPASLTWDSRPELQKALKEAAGRLKAPVFISVAENDQTTAVVNELNKVLDEKDSVVHFKRIYRPFVPHCGPPAKRAQGHAIYRQEGMRIWEHDVLLFLAGLSIGEISTLDTSREPCLPSLE